MASATSCVSVRKLAGWHCCIKYWASTCGPSIPFWCQFKSQLLHLQYSSLLMCLRKQQMMAHVLGLLCPLQALDKVRAPNFVMAHLLPLLPWGEQTQLVEDFYLFSSLYLSLSLSLKYHVFFKKIMFKKTYIEEWERGRVLGIRLKRSCFSDQTQ